jgi:3-phosphoshikimate 1-carboxyvinyltransferase
VAEEGQPGHLPLVVTGPLAGRAVTVPGDVSSQFTSGLLLAAGARPDGIEVTIGGDRLVSAPYLAMTTHVMAHFGVAAKIDDAERRVTVGGDGGVYRAHAYAIEADAATASYVLAAAALTGGSVTVAGLPTADLQADVAVVDVMEAMGCTVAWAGRDVTVTGPPGGRLRGGQTFDLTAFSDMAPTVAVLAAFADDTVEVTGVGFIRGKETDRIAASVAELRRVGARADETPDGFVVWPGGRRPDDALDGATIETYDDHRMAMSFALVGLVVPGISVADPGVVAKTHPGFWADLDRLRT